MATQILPHKAKKSTPFIITYWRNRITYAIAVLRFFDAALATYTGKGEPAQFENCLTILEAGGLTGWADEPRLDRLAELFGYNGQGGNE